MKKTLLFILLVLPVMLTACRSSAAQSPAAAKGAEKQTPVATVTEVIWYVRANEAEQKWQQEVVIPHFEKNNPHIRINLIVASWNEFDRKMQTMITAGTPPDIWSHWGPSSYQDYLVEGMVANLSPYIEQDKFDLSDFEPSILDIYRVDGKYMGLPMFTTGSFVFYNKDHFDRAGVEYPPTNWDDKTWTWKAFQEKCAALTNITGDPNSDIFGCNLDFWHNDSIAWLWGRDLYPDIAYQTGFAEEAFLGDPLVIDAFQARQDLVWKDHIMPNPAEIQAFEGSDLFETQKVSMQLTGGWGWWNYMDIQDFNWAVAALPYGADNRKDELFTDPWMLSSKTQHPDEAWEFLKFLVSPEVQRSWMDLTGAPPARKSLAEDWYKRFPGMQPEEVQEVHQGALKYGRETPKHLVVKFDQLNRIVSSAVDPIMKNEKKASEVLPNANRELIEALKQIKSAYQN